MTRLPNGKRKFNYQKKEDLSGFELATSTTRVLYHLDYRGVAVSLGKIHAGLDFMSSSPEFYEDLLRANTKNVTGGVAVFFLNSCDIFPAFAEKRSL